MDENLKSRATGWFVLLLIFLIIAGGLWFAYPKFVQNRNLRQHEIDLHEQIERQKLVIAKLRDNQRRFKTDRDFVEMIARQNRRVFPGELIFIIDK